MRSVSPGQAGRLGIDRLLERQRLEAAGDLVLVVGVGPSDRVAEQRDQLDLGGAGPPGRDVGVEQVVGAGPPGAQLDPVPAATYRAVSLVGSEAYQDMPRP
jgi:hypothetical protein